MAFLGIRLSLPARGSRFLSCMAATVKLLAWRYICFLPHKILAFRFLATSARVGLARTASSGMAYIHWSRTRPAALMSISTLDVEETKSVPSQRIKLQYRCASVFFVIIYLILMRGFFRNTRPTIRLFHGNSIRIWVKIQLILQESPFSWLGSIYSSCSIQQKDCEAVWNRG